MRVVTAQKMKFSIKDLVLFTGEILNGKLHFLCSKLVELEMSHFSFDGLTETSIACFMSLQIKVWLLSFWLFLTIFDLLALLFFFWRIIISFPLLEVYYCNAVLLSTFFVFHSFPFKILTLKAEISVLGVSRHLSQYLIR